MNRDEATTHLVGGIIAAVIVLVFGIAAARAEPCPPKLYACFEANWAFNHYGVRRVVAKARACGWTEKQIEEALKCQK
jgi:hypothetical protein